MPEDKKLTVNIKLDGIREVNEIVEDYAWLLRRLKKTAEDDDVQYGTSRHNYAVTLLEQLEVRREQRDAKRSLDAIERSDSPNVSEEEVRVRRQLNLPVPPTENSMRGWGWPRSDP